MVWETLVTVSLDWVSLGFVGIPLICWGTLGLVELPLFVWVLSVWLGYPWFGGVSSFYGGTLGLLGVTPVWIG